MHEAHRLAVLLLLCGFAAVAQDMPPRPAHGEPPAPEKYLRPELLTETLDLVVWQGPRSDGKLAIIDARSAADYEAGHLPGARNIESDLLQDEKNKPTYLVSADVLAKLAAKAGIDPDKRVVIYDAQGGRLAARVWFALWAYGHPNVSILNGGVPKWQDEKRPLVRDTPPAVTGTWKPAGEAQFVCAFGELKRFRPPPAAPGQVPITSLLDARTFQEYKGDDARSKQGGHVPGAVNIPWDVMLKPVTPGSRTEGQGFLVWRDAPEIHAILRAGGLIPAQPIAVYCQSGGRASHLVFTLKLMGYVQVANYCGGWREYGNREDVEVEK